MDIAEPPSPAAALPAGFSPVTCIAVRDETPTIRTFVLRPDDPAFLRFEAGQALVLSVDAGDGPLVRTFSVSSAPGAGDALELTIKAHSAGRATRWLHDHLVPGVMLPARPPRGRFTLAATASRKLAFVSAGSGATPLMSMLRALDLIGEPLDVAWHHSASAVDEVLFSRDLAELQARHPGLAVTVLLSRPAPGWFGYRGRISRRLLATAVPDIGRRDVFCCGPAGFMDAVKLIQAAEGGRPEAFHCEAFGAVPAPASTAGSEAEPLTGTHHSLTVGGQSIAVMPEETILQAALRHSIIIPCGCGQGMCGTCLVKGIEGRFDMAHRGGISGEEEAAGYLLACSTRLRGDAEITLLPFG
jgi:ferredoxin-NADP reductase